MPIFLHVQFSVLVVINTHTHRSSLINQALLDHFTHDCRIDRHFTALKRFILLEDGEFAHIISTRLCEQLTFSSWRDLYSASFLNPLLSTALESSLHGSSPETNRLSFAVSRMPTRVHTYGKSVSTCA